MLKLCDVNFGAWKAVSYNRGWREDLISAEPEFDLK